MFSFSIRYVDHVSFRDLKERITSNFPSKSILQRGKIWTVFSPIVFQSIHQKNSAIAALSYFASQDSPAFVDTAIVSERNPHTIEIPVRGSNCDHAQVKQPSIEKERKLCANLLKVLRFGDFCAFTFLLLSSLLG